MVFRHAAYNLRAAQRHTVNEDSRPALRRSLTGEGLPAQIAREAFIVSIKADRSDKAAAHRGKELMRGLEAPVLYRAQVDPAGEHGKVRRKIRLKAADRLPLAKDRLYIKACQRIAEETIRDLPVGG